MVDLQTCISSFLLKKKIITGESRPTMIIFFGQSFFESNLNIYLLFRKNGSKLTVFIGKTEVNSQSARLRKFLETKSQCSFLNGSKTVIATNISYG